MGCSEVEPVGGVIAPASPEGAIRAPEAPDFELLLSDLSAAFVRVSV